MDNKKFTGCLEAVDHLVISVVSGVEMASS